MMTSNTTMAQVLGISDTGTVIINFLRVLYMLNVDNTVTVYLIADHSRRVCERYVEPQ